MLNAILLKEQERIETGDFKLPDQYLQLIDQIVKAVEKSLRETNFYMRECKHKVLKTQENDLYIVYEFHLGAKKKSGSSL